MNTTINLDNIENKIKKNINNILFSKLKKNIDELGSLKMLQTKKNFISISITLSPHIIYFYKVILEDVQSTLSEYKNEIDFNLSLKIKVLPMSTKGILQKKNCFNIKNIILIASGKGGVGKSTVSSSLSFNLSRLGNSVGLLDADIYGPSVPTIWNIDSSETIKAVSYNKKQILVPIEKYNVKLMSIGFFAKKNDAMILRGPMITSTINQMITEVLWGELDYLIIDLPPGTGDIQISLMQQFPVSASVIVTTMQNICFADVLRAKNMLEKMDIPILGCVTNMSYFHCERCDHNYPIFMNSEGKFLLESLNLEILTSIPLDISVGNSIDSGHIHNFSKDSVINNKFLDLAYKISIKISKISEISQKILENQLPTI